MNVKELQELYDERNAPSAAAFRKALARKGIKSRLKDVEEFVRSKSERQVIAPGPKFTGHIVAQDIDHRWTADIVSFCVETRGPRRAVWLLWGGVGFWAF